MILLIDNYDSFSYNLFQQAAAIEPDMRTNHPLLHSKNTIVTPHIAFASAESMEARAEIVFQNIKTWLEGKQQNIIL